MGFGQCMPVPPPTSTEARVPHAFEFAMLVSRRESSGIWILMDSMKNLKYLDSRSRLRPRIGTREDIGGVRIHSPKDAGIRGCDPNKGAMMR
jgi:hypothetical protein